MPMKHLLLLIMTLLIAPTVVFADSYRPVAIGGHLARASSSLPPTVVSGPKFVKILKQSFEPAQNKQGVWRGALAGTGTIKLSLQILRNGLVESTRYVGKITLAQTDKGTTFAFKAPIPSGNGWSWKILAFAS